MKRLFVILCFLFLTSCWLDESLLYDVTYSVTCTSGTVDITINTGGNIAQYTDVDTPWSTEFEADEDTFVYVSAQNNQSNGIVTVSISKDGNILQSNSCSGSYCITTASGSVK